MPGPEERAGREAPGDAADTTDDHTVDLTPFDFLTKGLRGPASDPAQPQPEAGSGDGD
jgi:hypothetical protein